MVNHLNHQCKLKLNTYRVYSSATRARWDRFEPVLLRIMPVYHSTGQSFNAIPVVGSGSNHWAIALSQVPLQRGRSGMLISIIGRLVALLKVVLSMSGVMAAGSGLISGLGVGAARWEIKL